MFSRKRAEMNNTAPLPPEPKLVSTTGEYGGNDGPWSTFRINVGDAEGNGHGQNFKVLVSTSSPITLVPEQSEWCNDECAENRGVELFDGSQSQGLSTDHATWKRMGIYDIPAWDGGYNTSTKPKATWATDNVGIGQSSEKSLIVPQQPVVGSRDKELYMGWFGLAAGQVIPGNGVKGISPWLTRVAQASKPDQSIPSISYGYTAGAKYRNGGNGFVGNLVLGGYDGTRVNMLNAVSIGMPNKQNNTLSVGVQSITYIPDDDVQSGSFSFTKDTGGPFSAIIDSTFPYLWLPEKVCDQFEQRFGLTYDESTNFYTINSTAQRSNTQLNTTISFRIGSGTTESINFADITLPYSAFDKEFAEPPNVNKTRYFPIKKSRDNKFVLGRTFLQEAYLIVDYERANFTVAGASFPSPPPNPSLVPIYNMTYRPPSPTLIPTSGKDGGLSGGAIAGIVVGILVVALGVAFGIFMWWKKRRERKHAPPDYKTATEIDTSAVDNEIKNRRVSELDSEPPGSPKPPGLGGFYGENGDRKDLSPFPAISEMDSPPVPPSELYSPPAVASTPRSEGNSSDYFTAGGKLGRRGATRESSANNTPGTPPSFTPIAELPGDDGGYQVAGQHFEPVISPVLKSASLHKRDPSATPSNNIDEVMKRHSAEPSPSRSAKDESATEGTEGEDKKPETDAQGESLERRPSHTRGLSDTTVQSDTTVVSQPTPEELERWALAEDENPRRPLSE